MLLFFLPDGQIVLHTGDFRADPTMETLELRSYGVQTLYLDTTSVAVPMSRPLSLLSSFLGSVWFSPSTSVPSASFALSFLCRPLFLPLSFSSSLFFCLSPCLLPGL